MDDRVLVHTIGVDDRKAQILTNPYIVENGINVDAIDLLFDSEWEGLDINLVLSNHFDDPVRVVWSGKPVLIPSQVITRAKRLDVAVIGYDGDEVRMVASKLMTPFKIVDSGPIDGSEPPEDAKDIFGQLTDAYNKANEAADAANAAAENADEAAKRANDAADSIIGGGGGGTGTADYNLLRNRPSINGVTVEGDAESLQKYGAEEIPEDYIDRICI